ncbi:hypothetical protein VSR17_24945 [Cupriavidus taiwanensis]|uniref:hypothetical protein n=1 Tax=Cupriavidus taiwanensis TaxID=164546 RepID=UPI0011C044B7|nr:hypothetical protein [Cupriavidus taiwanensis]
MAFDMDVLPNDSNLLIVGSGALGLSRRHVQNYSERYEAFSRHALSMLFKNIDKLSPGARRGRQGLP